MAEQNPQSDPAAAGQSPANDPQQGGQSAGTAPTSGAPASSAPSQIPENLQGKSTEELVKMYGELSQKMGEHSGELGTLRDYKNKMDTVLQVVYEDRNLYDSLDGALKKKAGVSDTQPTGQPATPQADNETREVVESQLINQFADKHGLNTVPAEKRRDLFAELGNELVDIYDPTRKKTPTEVIKSIPLKALPGALEKAMTLYKARAGGDSGLPTPSNGEIGSMSAGSIQSQTVSLTEAEKAAAKKMRISEDDYLVNKKALREDI